MKKTVCYFGIYNPDHSRNRLNIKGLQQNGVEVLECNVRDKTFRKYWKLVKLFHKSRKQFDTMIVGFPGHPIMPLAWFLAKMYQKKIIFDAFISLYDSIILDEKKYSVHSYHAYKNWLLDWLSCRMADIVLLEVNEYAKYFVETFNVRREKIRILPVSCDDEVMYPRPAEPNSDKFIVHFHGTYIPAQGIDYIVEAADLLKNENIQFNIVGRLQDYAPVIEKAKQERIDNVQFFDFVPYQKLAELMAKADVCLGMFGDTEKAKRAGAFKIVEAMAMKKPLITADTPAVREFLIDRENCLLCRIADSKDLASKIQMLKNDIQIREKIAANGYQYYKTHMTPTQIGMDFLDVIDEVKR